MDESKAPPHVRSLLGRTFGRYRLGRLLGVGGMGSVYEAMHQDLRKRVALKIIHECYASDSSARLRFLREAQAAARIRHSHVADVYDVSIDEERPYLVMELLEGETLSQLIAHRAPLSVQAAADLLIPILAATAKAHDHGVIHRDLKPANIFLCAMRNGVHPKVLDFGISKLQGGELEARLTGTGVSLGTPHYMSPEQAQGASDIDSRSDQYSMGVVLYECVTGQRPMQDGPGHAVMLRSILGQFAPPRQLIPSLPGDVETLILRAMAPLRSSRFATMRRFGIALLDYASDRIRVGYEDELHSTGAFGPRSPRERAPGSGAERLQVAVDAAPMLPTRPANTSLLVCAEAPSVPPTRPGREPKLLGELWNVPALPKAYFRRPDLDLFKGTLLGLDAGSDDSRLWAVSGMAGIGKTMLAAALARDEDVRRAFPDGVFWLTLGQSSEDCRVLQARLARAIDSNQTAFATADEGRLTLAGLFSHRRCLLVLDDVWSIDHAEPFDVLGPGSRLMLTTRKEDVGRGLCVSPSSLEELSADDALELFAGYAGLPVKALPPEARALVSECGELPLALAMTGSALRGRPANRWRTMLERLRAADIGGLQMKLPGYPYRSLLASVDISVNDLDESQRQRYIDLAVFPEDVAIPESVLRDYWGLDEAGVQGAVDSFVDRSLVRRGSAGDLVLHDLQHDYLLSQVVNLAELDRRLLQAYRKRAPEGLHTVEDDGYVFRAISGHIVRGEGVDELRRLLFDLRWICAKITAVESISLLADFDLLDPARDTAVRLLQGALRLSSHVLAREPAALPQQLLGRLPISDDAEILQLRSSARQAINSPALALVRPTMIAPGGSLIRTFEAHQREVNCVALSRDGRLAASGSSDRTLRLWHVESGRCLNVLDGHASAVTAVALSEESRLALSGSADKTLKLWDVQGGRCIRTIEAHESAVTAVALSTAGGFAVSSAWDNTLKCWDLVTGQLIRTLGDPGHETLSFALSADNALVLCGSDKNLSLWNVATGELVQRYAGHAGVVNSVALNAGGDVALSASAEERMRLWDTKTGECRMMFHASAGKVLCARLSPDGKRVVSCSSDRTLRLWDSTNGDLLSVCVGHGAQINSLALRGDGRIALSGSADHTLKLWDLTRATSPQSNTRHAGGVTAVALSSDGQVALTASLDETLKLWNMETGIATRTIRCSTPPRSAALSGDGKRALSASTDGSMTLWTTDTGEPLRTLRAHEKGIALVAVDADGSLGLSACHDDKLIKLWDLDKGTLVQSFVGYGPWNRATLSADGRFVVSGARGHELKVWNAQTGEAVMDLDVRDGLPSALALSPDGRRLLVGTSEQALNLWDLERGELLWRATGHRGWVSSVALSPDGKFALSASFDKTVKLWDLDVTSVGASTGQKTTITTLHTLEFDVKIEAFAIDWRALRGVAGDALGAVHIFEIRP